MFSMRTLKTSEAAALRDALQQGLSISSAVSRAREVARAHEVAALSVDGDLERRAAQA